MRYLLFSLLLLGLASCSDGWRKDAFTDESENVKNAIPPGEKRKRIPPPEQDAIFIKVGSIHSVKEGESIEIPINVTITHPEMVYDRIEISNLDEFFEGSIYNSSDEIIEITDRGTTKIKGILQLTVKGSVVPAEGPPYVTRNLEVSVFAESNYEDKVQAFKLAREISINVVSAKENFVPEIVKISSFEDITPNVPEEDRQPIQEEGVWKAFAGMKYKYKIYVYSKNEYAQPSVQVSHTLDGDIVQVVQKNHTQGTYLDQNSEIVGEVIEKIVKDKGGTEEDHWKHLWEFEVVLSVDENPRTIDEKNKRVKLDLESIAYSFYGTPSSSSDRSLMIYQQPRKPKISIARNIVFLRGQRNTYAFSVVKPFPDSSISVECGFDDDNAEGATCGCEIREDNYFCSLSWEPEPGQEDDETFRLNIKMNVEVPQSEKKDDQPAKEEFTEVINVHVVSELFDVTQQPSGGQDRDPTTGTTPSDDTGSIGEGIGQSEGTQEPEEIGEWQNLGEIVVGPGGVLNIEIGPDNIKIGSGTGKTPSDDTGSTGEGTGRQFIQPGLPYVEQEERFE